MKNYGYTIGWAGKLWLVPYVITDDEIYEHVMATPHPDHIGFCGGVPPTETRGSIWWWVI